MPARIFVLAGVNGAGKSRVDGAALLHNKIDYFNPDLAARILLDAKPGLASEAANAQAWEIGRERLARTMAESLSFAFETTLGARTIPQMLIDGARQGAQVHGTRCQWPFSSARTMEARDFKSTCLPFGRPPTLAAAEDDLHRHSARPRSWVSVPSE